MEARAKKRTATAVTAQVGPAPKTALVIRDGEIDIPSSRSSSATSCASAPARRSRLVGGWLGGSAGALVGLSYAARCRTGAGGRRDQHSAASSSPVRVRATDEYRGGRCRREPFAGQSGFDARRERRAP